MSTRPQKPITGKPVETGYDKKLWLWIAAIEVSISNNFRLLKRLIEETGGAGGGSGETVQYIAKIKSFADDVHTADIYTNMDKDPIHETVTLKILQLASGEQIPNDTLLPCWQQEWGETESEETYWTADPARFY